MTSHAAPLTLSILLALACTRPASTVDAETTTSSSSPEQQPQPASPVATGLSTCWRVKPDSSGMPWLWPVPCTDVRPGGEPVPIVGICCTTPDGPCLAVDLASECATNNWFFPCEAGYETVDGNGEPTVVCYDNATG